ncbi:MAG: YsnF/AvaK domain-containing protein, partial [Chloroflexota bacterium]|nr:YsnF/AvaK domain-containing protein [Chloroflexota bacterium]
ELKAGVREKQGGTARIVKDVVEEQQSIDVPVQHEEVYVTERAVNRAATPEEMKMMDRDIEIPLKQQEVVTQKQAVVTGEVNIRKETTRETERVTDTVRREEVHVEDPNNKRVHVEGERGMHGQAETGGGKTVTDKRQYDAQGNLVNETERVDDTPRRSR